MYGTERDNIRITETDLVKTSEHRPTNQEIGTLALQDERWEWPFQIALSSYDAYDESAIRVLNTLTPTLCTLRYISWQFDILLNEGVTAMEQLCQGASLEEMSSFSTAVRTARSSLTETRMTVREVDGVKQPVTAAERLTEQRTALHTLVQRTPETFHPEIQQVTSWIDEIYDAFKYGIISFDKAFGYEFDDTVQSVGLQISLEPEPDAVHTERLRYAHEQYHQALDRIEFEDTVPMVYDNVREIKQPV